MNKAVIVAAPSGAGKGSIIAGLRKKLGFLELSISATTREPRKDEVNGREYFFLSETEFREKIKNGEFLEYEEVYPGLLYGTLWREIIKIWDSGNTPIFDVEIKGGLRIKDKLKNCALAIFINPGEPALRVLENRLIKNSEGGLDQAITDTMDVVSSFLNTPGNQSWWKS
jgi:guanylate kinase